MKTILPLFTLILSAYTPVFAAETGLKMLPKAQMISALSKILSDGSRIGKSNDGQSCTLIFSSGEGSEKLSMQSSTDVYDQRFLFDKDFESILFKVTENDSSIQINQDFDDSFQDAEIEKSRDGKIQATFTEYIAGDKRVLTCTFAK